ncbi:MAG: hypothetical protein ACLGQH_12975, partial [Acidobacteriota bacterium]
DASGRSALHGLQPTTPGFWDKRVLARDDPAVLARLLLEYGADPGLADANGDSPAKVVRERGLAGAAAVIEAAAGRGPHGTP